MTKKSYARMQRDQLKKNSAEMLKASGIDISDCSSEEDSMEKLLENNTTWDDLKELYQKSAEQLTGNYQVLIDLFKTPGLIPYLEQDEYRETLILFKGIQKDFEQLSSVLRLIYDRHAQRTGGAKTEDEFIESINIFEDYSNYTARYNALISPTFTTIVDRAGIALGKINEAVKAEQELRDNADVSIVKDVEFKMVSPSEAEGA